MKNADVLILASLTQTPTTNPDAMIGEFCVNVGMYMKFIQVFIKVVDFLYFAQVCCIIMYSIQCFDVVVWLTLECSSLLVFVCSITTTQNCL